MFDQYKLVSSSDDTSEDVPNSHTRPWHKPSFATAVIAVLSLANILLLGFSFILWRAAVEAATAALHVPPATLDPLNVSKGLAKVEALPVAYIPFHWNTPWGAPNATEADPLWDNINTAHGHIAVDHEWAAENNVSTQASIMKVELRFGMWSDDINSGCHPWTYLASLARACTFCKLTTSYTAW
jgi:hypothetical protein